ncbi:MAG: DUF3153 domain-containing protein [Cyanobium sp.]
MAPETDHLSTAFAEAKVAIERGNYARAVALLEPMLDEYSPMQPPGDILRLLLATALMGQGQGEQAAACCRSLQSCADPQRRAQARDLLQVLEAPALKRPRDWSLTLPRLDQAPPLEGVGGWRRSKRLQKAESPPPPPVGPTQSPRGFVAVVVALLVAMLLGFLLSGCLRVETDLIAVAPGRVRLEHRLRPVADTPLPFQRAFSAALAAEEPPYKLTQKGTITILSSPLLTPHGALNSLLHSWERASVLGGFALPPPALDWQETNWLVGVSQHVQIGLDLQNLPSLPGLDLSFRLTPFAKHSLRQARPNPVRPAGDPHSWIWQLEPGQVNHLEIRCWRWNPIALGGVLISLALLLVVLVQRMRVRLGLGLPELPA